MCEKKKIAVSKTKLFAPWTDWEDYLTKTLGETKEEKTVEGKLHVWEETRLPILWLYVVSFGKLEDTFVWSNGRFVREPMAVHEGKRWTTGIVLDTPLVYIGCSQTKKQTRTGRYRM